MALAVVVIMIDPSQKCAPEFLNFSVLERNSSIFCLDPSLLIRDGHITPVAARERRGAMMDSVYLAQRGGKNEGA